MTTSSDASTSRGFSLLEMLAVLVIIAGLTAASLAAYTSITQATAITTGAQSLGDLLTEARQIAMAQNITVEVRFYDISSPAGTAAAYRVVQLHSLKTPGATPPLLNPLFLPATVALDATATHSSIIGANSQTATPDTGDSRLNALTRVFHFLPDGSTDLAIGTVWSLTVRAATQSDPNHFPGDWACLTVDPATGHVQMFQP